jgi:hypothetical protein
VSEWTGSDMVPGCCLTSGTCEYLMELRGRLDSNRRLAARHFGAEDLPLADLHAQASQALLPAPIDLAAARMLVERYIAEVDRRIDEDEKEHGEV